MSVSAEDKIECIKSRSILWYLVFVGFSVNYMIRININIAIVDMIDTNFKKSTNNTIITSECLTIQNNTYPVNVTNNVWKHDEKHKKSNTENKEYTSLERRFLDTFEIDYEKEGFKWDEHRQNLVLGAFFFMHWLLQIPGGLLATKYGTKLVFGVSNVVGCLMCSLMPLASYIDFNLLIGLRVLQGLICGLAWPAMHTMTAIWIPPNERSKFVTAYLGSSVGVAVYYPVFGFIMKQTSWENVFHFCSIVGVIWYMFWLYFVYDTPDKHPRIDPIERDYIHEALGSSLQLKAKNEKRIIPWKAIFSSFPLWINIIAQFGGIWGLFTLLTQAPSYFRYVHGWGIGMTGILSGLPHILRMLVALLVSHIGDYMLTSDKMTRTNVRKMGTSICCILNGLFVLALSYSGCNAVMAVIFIILATGSHGAVSTGPLSAIVDLSPNYAGIVLGIVNMVCVLPGFLSPMLVSVFTFENQSIQQWRYVFLITATMLIVSGILYVFFADSTRQPWNNPQKPQLESNKRNQNLTLEAELFIDTKPNGDK